MPKIFYDETNPYEYELNRKFITRKRLYQLLSCTFCGPNRGCNSKWGYGEGRTWKQYRKTQYKPVAKGGTDDE